MHAKSRAALGRLQAAGWILHPGFFGGAIVAMFAEAVVFGGGMLALPRFMAVGRGLTSAAFARLRHKLTINGRRPFAQGLGQSGAAPAR
jgi:hypothetical protein